GRHRLHRLAVLAEKLSVRAEEEHAAVERSAVAFNHTDNYEGVRAFCRPGNGQRFGARDPNGGLPIGAVFLASLRGPCAYADVEARPFGIATEKGFRKNNEPCPPAAALHDQLLSLSDRRGGIAADRAGLDHSRRKHTHR